MRITRFHSPGIIALIVVGNALMLAALIAFGGVTISSLEKLRGTIRDLYVHPFAVSNAAQEVRGALFQLRAHMLRTVVLHQRADDVEGLIEEAQVLREKAGTGLAVIQENFLGDLRRVEELERHLLEWDEIRGRILNAARRGDYLEAERIVRTEGTPKFEQLIPLIDYVVTFAKGRAARFVAEAEEISERTVRDARFLAVALALFTLVTGLTMLARVRFLHRALEREATTDALTSMPNRRHFLALAEREFAAMKRYGGHLSVVVSDLDFFKRVNDTYGHPAGDSALKTYCQTCRGLLRGSDVLGRIGGEEFAILLPSTDLEAAREACERLRKGIEGTDVPLEPGRSLRITASFGVASYSPTDASLGSLLRRADHALYEAKSGGRNRVFLAREGAREGAGVNKVA